MSDKEELAEALFGSDWDQSAEWERKVAYDLADELLASDWLKHVRAEAADEALTKVATMFRDRLPDGTSNGRAYNSYKVAEMLTAQAQSYRGFTPMEGTKQ